jgi:membrane protein
MNKQELYGIFKTAFKRWLQDAPIRAAALTFFIILPLPTLLLIIISLFSQFIGQQQAIQIIMQQITALTGPAIAELFSDLIVGTGSPFTSTWTALVVIGFSLVGGIGAFSVLRDAMDCIWEVELPKKYPLLSRIRGKLVPFIVVSFLGLIVIAWTTISSTILSALIATSINASLTVIAIELAEVFLSFALATLLLAIIYKLIPQAKITWYDVSLAAVVTGIAFTAANYLFGAYIQTFTVITVAGVAGTLLIILLWIFVLNQIVLFGAELSKSYATAIRTLSEPRFPEEIEKAIEPLIKVCEKIEDAAKEEVVEIVESTVEVPMPEEGKKEMTSTDAPKKVETEELKYESKSQEGGSLEFSVKIKKPEKPKKDEV